MKTIEIKSLKLLNFKGIKSLEIDGFGNETSIHGQNGTGKTTIFDAFCWLLFGKDSTDRKDFEIKTLDENNNVIPKIDHEVSAVILVDGEEIELKRIFREKWVTRRGSSEAEFSGNETVYYWNDVPVSAGEYATKISGIVDEKVFKLITSPYAFNNLKWQEQREVLINLTGGVSNLEIADGNTEFLELLDKLGSKSVDEYRKQLAASIRRSKDELKAFPTRIDEVQRGKPEAVDFDDVERDIKANEKELTSVENQISDKLEAQQEILNKRSEIQKQIHGLESEIEETKHNILQEAKKRFRETNSEKETLQRKISEKQDELDVSKNGLDTLKSRAKEKEIQLRGLEGNTEELRSEWNRKNSEEFKMNESETKCPTCDREFEADKVEQKKQEAEARFKANKQKELNRLTSEGKAKADTLAKVKTELEELTGRIEKGEAHVKALLNERNKLDEQFANIRVTDTDHSQTEEVIYANLISENTEIPKKQKEIESLRDSLKSEEGVNVDDLKAKKDTYTAEIDQLKTRLSAKEQIKKADERIAHLGEEEKELAQAIADMEKDQYVIECFVKAKIERLEAGINEKFQMVNFKLFETQINGGEVETCKALINGVPFTDANTASRINAGIDIINTLCKFYEVSGPIFIDNRESVINLIESQSQIINLIVSEADKKLRVEASKEELETA